MIILGGSSFPPYFVSGGMKFPLRIAEEKVLDSGRRFVWYLCANEHIGLIRPTSADLLDGVTAAALYQKGNAELEDTGSRIPHEHRQRNRKMPYPRSRFQILSNTSHRQSRLVVGRSLG